jgi:hypothetical protein
MVGITAWESKVTSHDEPSGALFATCAAPSEPAAPDLFSTITTRFSRVCSGDCSCRASASVDPPGGNGTTSVTVLDCAQTGADVGATASAAVPASTSRLVNVILSPPDTAAVFFVVSRR